MDIYILSRDFDKLDIIDYCDSIIWTRRYCNAGDFELYIPVSADAVKICKAGNYVMRSDMPDCLMIIEEITITTSEEEGDYLTVRGRSA